MTAGMTQKLPKLIAESDDISGTENFPSGGKFSPDGLCVLTSTNKDSKLRLYNTVFPSAALSDETDQGDPAGDGSCASTSLARPWKSELLVDGGNAVRCYEWYPKMRSDDPASCCFASTARNQPIHLHDAYSGLLRATYRAYNSLDELESAMVISFHPSGQNMAAAGFRTADQRVIHIFDLTVPGRQSSTLLLGKTRRSKDGQKGLVSAMAYGSTTLSQGNLLAVGTYAPGTIFLYDQRTGPQPSGTILRNGHCIVGHTHERQGLIPNKRKRFDSFSASPDQTCDGTGSASADANADVSPSWLSSAKRIWYHERARGGVTQLKFAGGSQDFLLYSSSRRSNTILSWDLRMLSDQKDYATEHCNAFGFSSFATDNDTNQRLEFDLDATGETLFAAGKDKCVRIYDTKSGSLKGIMSDMEDAVNGVSFGRAESSSGDQQFTFLAVSSGSRHFPSEDDFDSEATHDSRNALMGGRLRLYQL